VPEPEAGVVVPEAGREEERRRALAALEAAAAQLDALAGRLADEGRAAEADVVAAGAMMARDPTLEAAVADQVARGRPAAAALQEGVEAASAPLRALDDPTLALRADDLRSVGRRAARIAAGAHPAAAPDTEPAVLVAVDLGPADIAELDASVAGLALGAGGATTHAAIVARSLGLPMVVGLGDGLADVAEGTPMFVDGDGGRVAVAPAAPDVLHAEREGARRAVAARRARDERDLPAETRDGHRVRVLANVASRPEVDLALAAGAEGVGLLRTELAFLDARGWPGQAAHERALRPLLEPLAGRVATVRLLDFGGDKEPPFLRGAAGRGIELLLAEPLALGAQVAAVVAASAGVRLRVLVPMVTEVAQLRAVREILGGAGELGAMVEAPAAATLAGQLAAAADLLSIGTNDLSSLELGRSRHAGEAPPVHHPAVLRRVAEVVAAGRAAGIPVAVCGEAASDPRTLPLLVGLGVDELSVGAARVGEVRAAVRSLDHAAARAAASRALDAEGPDEVLRVLDEAGHELGQGGDR
jgi:phosphoenolpyruvate-protein kinase (PTS system EI component)